ncbi:terminase large subunit (plasmid) [Crassaminicella thermophila]|uniref:Terminase large subunit n=1 Tax=Crassaminicella thermophila TaxID=2599308 RepID=A0A5C0SKK9_CRATE|nr:terminase TerL endonuclease subunit [Crassaminicella thermophila]QEK13718.1 terminase large subunit [Crassaminicella thermophila]
MILLDKAIKYATDVVEGKEITTKEVIIQCKWFLIDYNKRQHKDDFEFYFDTSEMEKIEGILKLLNFATGLNIVGKTILDGLWGFQAFFLCNIFGWRFKTDKRKFRYRDVTLFIPRKNAKTFICALILIILMLTEDKHSEFYSICLDRELAGEVKKAITQIIQASPVVEKYFKLSTTLSGKIICKLTNSYYQARTAEANRNNSIRPSAFIADEIGAFRDYKNITAMQSGQLSVRNPLRFKLTTAYAESESIMLEELDYIRKVYDGVIEDKRMFALLYYAEDEHKWDDIGLQQANPLRIKENYQEIKDNRKKALEKPSERTEFLTKHMNIFVDDIKENKYIDFTYWKKGELEKIDLEGKEVVVGVDLSLTTDLTAVDIMYKKNGQYFLKSHAFLPEDTLPLRREKIDYRQMEKLGYCTITKGNIVDYLVVEDYIRNIEESNCKIKCIVSDPYNALQMMQSLANDYEVIMLKQTYSQLSPSIKSFRDDVYKGNIFYEKNKLLDWCMSNATTVKGRTTDDILLAKENKNKHRIDLVVAAIFAYSQLYLIDESINIQEVTEDYLNMMGW